jgi:hypothetical protein
MNGERHLDSTGTFGDDMVRRFPVFFVLNLDLDHPNGLCGIHVLSSASVGGQVEWCSEGTEKGSVCLTSLLVRCEPEDLPAAMIAAPVRMRFAFFL